MKKAENGKEKDVYRALYKKAMGYTASESVEEYTASDDEIRLSKKKITRKHVPPDVSALKVLLTMDGASVSEMTDGELEEEKRRLLKLLKEYENEGENGETEKPETEDQGMIKFSM